METIRLLYSQMQALMRVYYELSKSFPIRSGVLKVYRLYPFLFNLVIHEIMKRTIDGLQNLGVRVMDRENLVDLLYADYIILIFKQL